MSNINNIVASEIKSKYRYLYNKVEYCVYEHKKLLLAYSGGLDSTVLLDILAILINNCVNIRKNSTFPIFLKAIHVHHGISNQSDMWVEHCRKQCKIRNIPFDVIYINCLDYCYKKNSNIESIARNLRYKSLCNCLDAEEVLLTAHHIDDQLETVLLALKRGSGPAGLSGINKDILLYKKYRLLRPLIECSRIQLTQYAMQRELVWIEDDTNIDVRFDRNFLRTQVIPILKKKWPALNIVVARTAQLCKNQENLLCELLSESLRKLTDIDGSLFIYPLLQYSVLKRQAILRLWLKNYFINMPSYQLLNRIWTEVALSKVDSNPVLCLGQYICRRFRKKLYILPIEMTSVLKTNRLSWTISDNVIKLPGKLGLIISQILISKDFFLNTKSDLHVNTNLLLNTFFNYYNSSGKILTNCLVRLPRSNEKVSIRFGNAHGLLYILNRNRGRKLKKIWQELCIPPWLRSRIPLLFYNNTLIAALGIFITRDGQAITKDIYSINDNYIIWRVFWLQDCVQYQFFRNIIYYFLK